MLRHFERDETGLGTGHGVCAQEFIGEEREAIDPHGFQSLIKRSGFTRSFDPRFDETKVFVEYGVLERDRQRENAVGGAAYIDRSFKEALYEPLIRQAEARYQLPPRLLQALIWQESRFNPMAISPAGAAGLAQLMPGTARQLGVSNRHDPVQNIDGGARYLKQMLDRFGAIHLALAAYNAGPGAVSRAGGIPKNRETPGYVKSVIARWMAYSST